MVDNGASRMEREEIVSTPIIAGGSQAYGPNCMQLEIIGMFFMSLHICTELGAHVTVIVEVLPSHDVLWREGCRDTIRMWECIEPEYCIA